MSLKNETAWCPGCGNFGIRSAIEEVLRDIPVSPQDTVFTSGIGQAAKMPHYLDVNYFNGLHGRSIPVAVGIKLARPELTVIAYSGDGCIYGEGGNHFIHTIRKNIDITILISDNKVYGLTKGQSSPTTDTGSKNTLDPQGNANIPLNPLSLAITMGAPFVARGFAGEQEHLKAVIKEAILFRGTAIVDILQPCVTFNKINTYQFYRERVYKLDTPVTDKYEALKTAEIWGEKIPIGVIYKNESIRARETEKWLFRNPVSKEGIIGLLKTRHATAA
ncbi:MAG: thiamine pyrophosphate-dependent enzyme [Deltaproteobacteria bacterium]|nr:thiamine pyrophosphate-dependent enzyme [Deltaproteobacteria bacterium]